MKNLVILNGPAGVGKSTIAQLLHSEIKPSYLLSCDSIRRFLNDYHDFPREARTLRNKVVMNMLDVLLAENLTVILEQLHTDNKMLDEYHRIAKKHHATVNEFFIWVSSEEILLDRFRGRDEGPTRHPESSLTKERISRYWHKMRQFTENRNLNNTIITDNITAQETAKIILKLIV